MNIRVYIIKKICLVLTEIIMIIFNDYILIKYLILNNRSHNYYT